ncbi:MAG: DNA-processing protein DprA [Actinobacteria bacterium]|nr:DNA-processing protein DprA [Actinomycetota bacterium]
MVLEGKAIPPKGIGAKGIGAKVGGDAAAYERWLRAAQLMDVGALWRRCSEHGIGVVWLGGPSYPGVLASGPAPPGVLFCAGDLTWAERCPVVAVVGTRRCTPEGAGIAYQLAKELAMAGVCVVSGLALGIDGSAHAGALAGLQEAGERGAATVGVAASGVDVVYPRQHAGLWKQIVSSGAVISETPPGTPAQSWRFPSRNRVIAGLARMVVVVESHITGGSWHTVDAALRAGVEVAAVPGSVRSPASAGTNTLLRDGATPVRGAQDVLDALGLSAGALMAVGRDGRPGDEGNTAPSELAPLAPAPLAGKVLAALGWRPLCLEELVERSGLPVGAAVVVLEQLEADGVVASSEDGWWRRLG